MILAKEETTSFNTTTSVNLRGYPADVDTLFQVSSGRGGYIRTVFSPRLVVFCLFVAAEAETI